MNNIYDICFATITSPNRAETYSVSASSSARYYNSDLSIWLSVDPLVDKYPNLSPYVYCANNPGRLVDPDGRKFGWVQDENGTVFWDKNTNSHEEFAQNYADKSGYSYVSDNDNPNAYTLPNGMGKLVVNQWTEWPISDGCGGTSIELEFVPANKNNIYGWLQTFCTNEPNVTSDNDVNVSLPMNYTENRIDFQGVDKSNTNISYWNPCHNTYKLCDQPKRCFNEGASTSVIWQATSSMLINNTRAVSVGWGFSIDSKNTGNYNPPQIIAHPNNFHINVINSIIR